MRIKYANPLRKFRLSRLPDKRYHLIRNLVTQLITHERIVTTSAKAKHMRSTVERVLNFANRLVNKNHRHLRSSLNCLVTTKEAQTKLFEEIVPRLADTKGACTRVSFLRKRKGDNAPLSMIEIIGKLA